jgi:hypothetical protein
MQDLAQHPHSLLQGDGISMALTYASLYFSSYWVTSFFISDHRHFSLRRNSFSNAVSLIQKI